MLHAEHVPPTARLAPRRAGPLLTVTVTVTRVLESFGPELS
jgi:hypothetical protein